jgi:hypothetical protein
VCSLNSTVRSHVCCLVGTTDLPKWVVDIYYEQMNNVTGFLNGYAPSFTFTSRNKTPFMSFDYYLDPERTIAEYVRLLLLVYSLLDIC